MQAPDKTSPRVALLGAFDRFNYGDLLFPIVSRKEIEAHSPGTATAVHALVASDLSAYGALPSLSLRDLYRPGALRADDVVLFAGGGTVGVDWTFMLSNLLGPMGNAGLKALTRVLGFSRAEAASRRYFGAHSPYPWVAGPEDFPVPVKVAYNAIGGSELVNRGARVQHGTLQRLALASYLSVRDNQTQQVFASVQDRVQVHVAPDSAVLMSEQFPLPRLRALSSASALATVDESPYLCFHANRGYMRRHVDQIVTAIEKVYEAHGLPAVLLPIGRYVGLDDHLGLAELKQRLRTPARMASDQASLWEIMLTIAQSSLFLGTSLHGAVTSQSFAVPHLGMSERPSKLDHYLSTWDLPQQAHCVALKELPDRVAMALAVDSSARVAKRDELIGLAQANFSRLASACGIRWR
jgi:hypothetical protein